jgi:hypothetical protein
MSTPWNPLRFVICAALVTAAHTVAAQDRAELDATKVIGNRELPKVLYIVPWKKPPQGELAGRPVKSVIDEALAPVDRDVFRRHAQYDQQIQKQREAAAAPAAAR